jgi:hypothetical protein
VTLQLRRWRHSAGTALVLVTVLAIVQVPGVFAQSQSPGPTPVKPELRLSAARIGATLSPPPRAWAGTARTSAVAAGQTSGATGNRDKWSFFKSPIGIAVMGAFATGVGYALYSTQHDRVHSAGKQ